jgi:hypothetical protein
MHQLTSGLGLLTTIQAQLISQKLNWIECIPSWGPGISYGSTRLSAMQHQSLNTEPMLATALDTTERT